jgi:nuclease YhcG-like protein
LTWYHNIALLERLDDADLRLWYARNAILHGWSRNVLVLQYRQPRARAARQDDRAQDRLVRPGLRRPAQLSVSSTYLSATDDLLRHPDDRPTIGLLLRRSKDELVVEYALRDVDKPIGVAQWATRLVETLPADLEGSLPTVAQIEAELGDGDGE